MRFEITTTSGLVFKWRGRRSDHTLLLEKLENAVFSYERAELARLEVAKLKAKVKK